MNEHSPLTRVLGSIIATAGLLGLLYGATALTEKSFLTTYARFYEWQFWHLSLGLLISLFQIYVGAQIMLRKERAPTLALAYGIIAFVAMLLWVAFVYINLKPELGAEALPRVGVLRFEFETYAGLSGFWALLMLVLSRVPKLKQACLSDA